MKNPASAFFFTPGAPAAKTNGCLCPVIDNGHGAGVDHGTGTPVYTFNLNCPLHGEWTLTTPTTLVEGDALSRVAELRYKAAVEMYGPNSPEALAANETFSEARKLDLTVFSAEAKNWYMTGWA